MIIHKDCDFILGGVHDDCDECYRKKDCEECLEWDIDEEETE